MLLSVLESVSQVKWDGGRASHVAAAGTRMPAAAVVRAAPRSLRPLGAAALGLGCRLRSAAHQLAAAQPRGVHHARVVQRLLVQRIK